MLKKHLIKKPWICFKHDAHCRRQYSSEYQKSFRPFSHYEYVDGKFVPSSYGLPPKPSAIAAANANKAASLHGEPWYQEVVELRRQAQDYKVKKF